MNQPELTPDKPIVINGNEYHLVDLPEYTHWGVSLPNGVVVVVHTISPEEKNGYLHMNMGFDVVKFPASYAGQGGDDYFAENREELSELVGQFVTHLLTEGLAEAKEGGDSMPQTAGV